MLRDLDLVNAYQRAGAVIIRGLFDRDQISLLESGIEQNLRSPGKREKIASRPDDPARFFEDFCNWQNIDACERFIQQSDVDAIGAMLMQSRFAGFTTVTCWSKRPATTI